ncbi:MAG: hypothetical protein DMF69_03130 [Acidobacteria bacterium]|nr:MAG: hypothetical protein DMF69_03130 [Acidobacteriota bacterium]
MGENGNHPEVKVAASPRRVKASWPILVLAALFLSATFLAWYFTWFGRGLSDADIGKYLSDTKNPRHVQHALLQIQQQMERRDPAAKNWYPQIEALSAHPETEFRLTTAWVMGFDNQSEGFHQALLRLVKDEQPIVRRNAALALVRFNDHSGRDELTAVLKPYSLKVDAAGLVSSTLHAGSEVSRGTLLARIQQPEGNLVEVRSPLLGRIEMIDKPNGSQVNAGDELLRINSDEDSVWEALRGLALIWSADDLPSVQTLANSNTASARVKEQARLAAKSIESRKVK